jgi:hypothetical protein
MTKEGLTYTYELFMKYSTSEVGTFQNSIQILETEETRYGCLSLLRL